MCALAVSAEAWAKEIRLYRLGKQTNDYSAQLKSVYADDVFAFEDGNKFKVVRKIDRGNLTEVYLVEPLEPKPGEPARMVLRLPVLSGESRFEFPYTQGIDAMLESAKTLRENGARIPEFYRSAPGQYIAVEHIPHDFDLKRFLRSPTSIPADVREEAEAGLKEFARRSARLGYIDDFHVKQLVYNAKEKEWVVLDWMGGFPMPFLHVRERNHIFGDHFVSIYLSNQIDWASFSKHSPKLSGWERHVLDAVHHAIEAERKRIMPYRSCFDGWWRAATANPI